MWQVEGNTTQDFRKLAVWVKARSLTLAVYRITDALPRTERYVLTTQLRRAAISVESNIAEGCGRSTPGEFRQFLSIALGSAKELDSQIQLVRDLHYIDGSEYRRVSNAAGEVQRMLAALIRRCR